MTLDHSHDRCPPPKGSDHFVDRRQDSAPRQRSDIVDRRPRPKPKDNDRKDRPRDQSQGLCLPNAPGRTALRGRAGSPKVLANPGGDRMHYLFTMSNTRNRSQHGNHRELPLSRHPSQPLKQGKPAPHARTSNLAAQPWQPQPGSPSIAQEQPKNWWSQTGSNRRPEACKATALPTELWPLLGLASNAGRDVRPLGFSRHAARRPVGLATLRVGSRATLAKANRPPAIARRRLRHPKMVGLGRLERPTSPLSGVRSNHLSYRPVAAPNGPSAPRNPRSRACQIMSGKEKEKRRRRPSRKGGSD